VSRFTHPICRTCWDQRQPGREPVALIGDYRHEEACCYCDVKTLAGIYVRDDPTLAPCLGLHEDFNA